MIAIRFGCVEQRQHVPAALAIVLCSWISVAAIGSRESRVSEIEPARPFLRWDRPGYQNYALIHFQNYPNHYAPHDDTPLSFIGPLGNELITGYDLYAWRETRTPGQKYGSSIFKPNLMYNRAWNRVYDAIVIGRDGYGDWGYSLIVGDNMIARLSPLTLSMTDFNGFRLDVAMPRLKLTGMASRIERPHVFQTVAPIWAIETDHFADDSTVLLGGRIEGDLGVARLGVNLADSHVYRSTQSGNDLRGVLRPDQPLMDWLIVRFSDDSPADGEGGAVVQGVVLQVNGAARRDLRPTVVRHRAGVGPQVGSASAATGRFRAVDYRLFSGNRLYYRGRNDLPLYADYFYRLDHEDGVDVSDAVRLEGLLANFQLESPDRVLTADGDEQLVFLFDLTGESRVESIELEALLANDYRVDVALLTTANARARNYYSQFRTTFYRIRARAPGNVSDRTNLRRVRLEVGEDTGLLVYSADASLSLPGLELKAELARSARYARYPAHADGALFSTGDRFTTTYRTFLNETSNNLQGMINETVYWDLVQDNDDGDRMPDRRIGDIEGFVLDDSDYDLDGVFLDQDADKDGFPDINRDGDRIPDFEKPFLMFDVEPNRYVYGLDRNNNDEVDRREDDGQVDYPYDPDQRGYHLFAQVDLLRNLSLALGRYDVDELAGSGRNRVSYALITFHRRSLEGDRWLLLENNASRVEDDIPDEYVVTDENSDRNRFFNLGGLTGGNIVEYWVTDKPPIFSSEFVTDLASYQDSYVNETYLETRFQPWSTLSVLQKLRVRFNWQQGGKLYNGIHQRARRLDFWTWVSRMQYNLQWGKLTVTPQYKFMLLRLRDQERQANLLAERRSIPILRLEYTLLPRTTLRAGVQGVAWLPYRFREVAARNSFEQRTWFVSVINRSKYFGYELVTIAGVNRDTKEFDTRFRDVRDFDVLSVFVRGVIGFTEFGQPI